MLLVDLFDYERNDPIDEDFEDEVPVLVAAFIEN